MKKILLYSGGVDSWLINQIWKPDIKLYVNLGTSDSEEEMALFKKNNENVNVINFNLSEWELSNKIIPLRNLYLLMLACNFSLFEDVEICLGATVGDRNHDKTLEFFNKSEDLLNYIYSEKADYHPNRKIKLNTSFKNKSKTDLLKMYLKQGGDINKAYNETHGAYKENMSLWQLKKFYKKFMCFKLNGYVFPAHIEKRMYHYFKNNKLKETLALTNERGHEKEEMLKVFYMLENIYGNE